MRKLNHYRHISILMIHLILLLQFLPLTDITQAAGNENDVKVSAAENVEEPMQTSQVSPFTPGDGILIDTFPDTASFLNQSFAIDNMGMVEFPMIGKVKVTDKTTAQVEELLKTRFKAYLRYPILRVKPVIRISVLGGVARPCLYYFDYNQSLWTVLQEVGGPLLEDGLNEMHIERNTDVFLDDIHPYYERGSSLQQIGIRSGDQIWVPSPTRPTFWQDVQQVLPLLTFAGSLYLMYLTYQQSVITARVLSR